jgi:hypothetical protein
MRALRAVASLKARIAAGLQSGSLTSGSAREEAQALWTAALRDAPRFRTPFQSAWFEQVAEDAEDNVQGPVIPGVGHWLAEEAPEAMSSALRVSVPEAARRAPRSGLASAQRWVARYPLVDVVPSRYGTSWWTRSPEQGP